MVDLPAFDGQPWIQEPQLVQFAVNWYSGHH